MMLYSNVFNPLFYDTIKISMARNDRERRSQNFEVRNEDKLFKKINELDTLDFRLTKDDYYLCLEFETGNILSNDKTRVNIFTNSKNDKQHIRQIKMLYPSEKLPLELEQHNILRCEVQFKNKESVSSAYYRKNSNGMRVKWGDLKDFDRAKEMYGKAIKDFNHKELIANGSSSIDELFSILEKNTLYYS